MIDTLLTLTRAIIEANVNSNYQLLDDSTHNDLRTIERELEEEMAIETACIYKKVMEKKDESTK